MVYVIVILSIFIVIDLIFYIPMFVNVLIAEDKFAIYFFSIPIIYIDESKTINHLKNKISIQQLKNADPEDVKYIESLKIEKVILNYTFIDKKDLFFYYIRPILYMFKSFDLDNRLSIIYNSNINYYFYAKISFKIARVLKFYFIIRRIKQRRERTSNF